MEALLKKLKSNGMDAYYFTNSNDAKAHILNMIPKTSTVGIGGSVTVREMGLLDAMAGGERNTLTTGNQGLAKRKLWRLRGNRSLRTIS